MTLDQAATLMGVGPRHTRRMLAVYRERGAAALAHGHRGRRAPNATPDALAADVVHLAGTRYARASQRAAERTRGHPAGLPAGILVNAGLSSPRQRRPPHRVRRQRMPACSSRSAITRVLGDQVPPFTPDRRGRCHRPVVNAIFMPAGGRPQLLPADAIPDRELRQDPSPCRMATGTGSSDTHPAPASLGCPPSSAVLWRSWGSR